MKDFYQVHLHYQIKINRTGIMNALGQIISQLGHNPLSRSGSGSAIQGHYYHGATKEPDVPVTRVDSSILLLDVP